MEVAMTIVVNQTKVTAALDEEASRSLTRDKVLQLLFEVNFDQENRLRVLEGKPQIIKLQYKDALIALYKTL